MAAIHHAFTLCRLALALAAAWLVLSAGPARAAGIYMQAVDSMNAGDYTKAVELFTQAHVEEPLATENNVYFYLYLGNCFQELGKYPDAVKVYEEGREKFPGDSRLVYGLGWSYHRMGLTWKAVEVLEAYLEEYRDNVRLILDLGFYQYSMSQYTRAIETIDRGLALEPRNMVGLYRRALVLMKLDRYADAAEEFEKVKRIEAEYEPGWLDYNLAASYLNAGRCDMALKSINEAHRLAPDVMGGYDNYYINLGAIQYCLGAYADVRRVYEDALVRMPDNVGIASTLAWTYHRLGDTALAAKTSGEFLASHQDSARTLSDLGFFLLKLGRHSEALARLDQAVALAPKDMTARFRRGMVKLDTMDHAAAAADFEAVLDKAPETSPGWVDYDLALVYMGMGRYAEAAEHFLAARRRNADEVAAGAAYFTNLGTSQHMAGQPDNAVFTLSEGAVLHPEDLMIHELLGTYELYLGNMGQALEHLTWAGNSAALLYADLPPVQMRLPFAGGAYVSQGNGGQASHIGLRAQYAWDFAITGPDGAVHNGVGARNEDYYCFGSDVLAPADGVVTLSVDSMADNAPGERGIARPDGNMVVMEHAPDKFSYIKHMRNGSITVRPGQSVKAGQKVGECGNSGYSDRPHIHFSVNLGPEKLSAGRRAEFTDYYVIDAAGKRLVKHGVPAEGETIANAGGK